MRRFRDEAVALVGKVAALARLAPHRPMVSAGVSMAFGCSIAGAVDPGEVLRLAEAMLDAGADMVSIADTVGYAGPKQVGELSTALAKLCGDTPFAVHLHDTRGMAIANASAALDAGARVLDGALGGLGGCPYAPGATGNAVFEDLVFLCETKGFATGIDLDALIAVREILGNEMPGEPLYGALARSGPPRKVDWRP
jgi:hydroxymethylglutaryl-CoA lyase